DRGPPIPSSLRVRERCVGTILCLSAQEVHRPHGGDASATLSRPRQPRSCVAGHRQGVRRRPDSPIIQAASRRFNQQEALMTMNAEIAIYLAQALNIFAFIALAIWCVVPRLRRLTRAGALMALT